MSASGIPNANPVTPASWAPAPQQGTPPPASHRDSGDTASATHKPAHPHPHKVDVKV